MITCSTSARGQVMGPAHLEAESAVVLCSFVPAGITRGDTETEQGFRGEVTEVMGVSPGKEKWENTSSVQLKMYSISMITSTTALMESCVVLME